MYVYLDLERKMSYKICLILYLCLKFVCCKIEFQIPCSIQNDIGICIPPMMCPKYKVSLESSWLSPNVIEELVKNKCETQETSVCCPLTEFKSIKEGLSTTLKTPLNDYYVDITPSKPTTSTSSTEKPVSPTTVTTTTTSEVPLTQNNESKPNFNRRLNNDDVHTLPVFPNCGYHRRSPITRVVNGFKAKLGFFPWMALLGYRAARGGTEYTDWLCGGSIITPRHILTAAHCIADRKEDLHLVKVGELDLDRDDDGATPMDIPIKTKIVHPGYLNTSNLFDIGILVLEDTLTFNDLISPICVPKNETLLQQTFEGHNPFLSGWGELQFRGPAASHLQGAMLQVSSNDYCARAYSSKPNIVVDKTILCTHFNKKSSCQGDSGSPLAQPVNTDDKDFGYYFYQIGVVSSGGKCAEHPSIFTRITHYVPWIEEVLAGTQT